jgi:hypothetical protein
MTKTDEWVALITPQHADKPKYMATVRASVSPFSDIVAFLGSLPSAFDLDEARGAQLDTIGQWAGVSRYIPTPLTGVYFTLGTAGLGLGGGHLKGPFDPDTGLTALSDDSYRVLLKGQIASNAWDGTIPGAYAVWEILFKGSGTGVVIQDRGGMQMLYALSGVVPDAVTLALFKTGYLNLKPAGVRISAFMTPYASDVPYFGLGVQNSSIAGLGAGAFSNIYSGI